MQGRAAAVAGAGGRHYGRAVAWLLLLGPLFYASYGLANWWAGTRPDVPTVVFGWERHIPFLAWTIFPYWSINLLYALSPFLGRTRHRIDRHGLRLLTVQLLAVACFLLWPLRFSFGWPEVSGAPALLFDALRSFDQPYNQAPSLHIALTVILWDWYQRLVHRLWARLLVHAWALLIAISVLTTWQHHFIDLPTGALLGIVCVWLWPLQRRASLCAGWRLTRDGHARRLALYYGLGAAVLLAWALAVGSWALWLAWPAAALLAVALNYLGLGVRGFAMDGHGRMAWAARWLLAPYRLGATINAWLWTRRQAPAGEVVPGLWVGRLPNARTWAAHGRPQLLSLCAELQAPRSARASGQARALPLLDLLPPTAGQLRRAATMVEAGRLRARDEGRELWVCCALGYGRSTAAVAAWLLHTGQAADVAQAEALLRAARPQLAWAPALRARLQALVCNNPSP